MTQRLQQILDNILRDESSPLKIPICSKSEAQQFYSNPNTTSRQKRICKYYSRGYCEKKDSCLYEHVKAPVVDNSRYKTEMCKEYSRGGACRWGDRCNFAHGEKELKRL